MVKRGPKTPVGKAKVRLNAVQHGILSTSPVIPNHEKLQDWQRHHHGIMAAFDPEDELEASLAERIALLLWRLRRVVAYETEAIIHEVAPTNNWWKAEEDRRRREGLAAGERFQPKDEWLRQHAYPRMIPNDAISGRVMRYESHLHRQLLQTMHELEARQDRRKGKATPLARLDMQMNDGTLGK
jgi:hypothetical protein